MKERLEQFMIGRYGVDDLSKWTLGLSVVLMLINLMLRLPLLNTVVLLLFVWIYYRMFSRQVGKRYAENAKFLEQKNRVLGYFRKQGSYAQDLKTHHIYRCPQCRQKIRVPRGRGRIAITCPRCKHEFIKKS